MNRVYSALTKQIVSGDYAVGTQLTEAVLARRFGVSRTPIREALRRLEQDGLVERSPRGGIRVKVWSVDEVFDLYEVRIVLEAQSASVAAERRTQVDLMRLRQANDAMREASSGDGQQLRTLNLAFHERLWQASHNKALIDVLTRLQRQIMRHPASTLTHPGRWADVLSEHDELVEAIGAGDAMRAGAIAGGHIKTARDLRLKLYQDDVAPGPSQGESDTDDLL